MTQYTPGTYVKGDQVRRADTAADAVAAVFDGFTRSDDGSAEATETADSPSDTSATRDEPSGTPVDETDPFRSFS